MHKDFLCGQGNTVWGMRCRTFRNSIWFWFLGARSYVSQRNDHGNEFALIYVKNLCTTICLVFQVMQFKSLQLGRYVFTQYWEKIPLSRNRKIRMFLTYLRSAVVFYTPILVITLLLFHKTLFSFLSSQTMWF